MKHWLLWLLLWLGGFGLPAKAQQWIPQTLPEPAGTTIFAVNIIEVVDTSIVWAARNQEVLRTTNGGKTWLSFPVPDPNFEGFRIQSLTAVDSATAWLTAINYNLPAIRTRVMKTTDGGKTWQHQASAFPKPVSFAYGIHFFDTANGVVMGFENPTTVPKLEIYTTSDGGNNWLRVPEANLPPPVSNISYNTSVEAFSVVNNSIWFLNANPAAVYRSTDRGLHWSVSNLSFPAQSGALYFSLAFSDSLNGLASRNGVLQKTTDGGLSWQTISPSGPFHTSKLAAVPDHPDTYFSGDYYQPRNGSSVSRDGGYTWQAIETYLQHFDLEFASSTIGWSGSNGKLQRYSPLAPPPVPGPPVFSDCFRVFPVPSSGQFSVRPCQENTLYNVRIFDMAGREIYRSLNNRSAVLPIDLSNQAAGIYLLQILSGEKQFVRKIMLLP